MNDPDTRIATPVSPFARQCSFSTTWTIFSRGLSPFSFFLIFDKLSKMSFWPTYTFPEKLPKQELQDSECAQRHISAQLSCNTTKGFKTSRRMQLETFGSNLPVTSWHKRTCQVKYNWACNVTSQKISAAHNFVKSSNCPFIKKELNAWAAPKLVKGCHFGSMNFQILFLGY